MQNTLRLLRQPLRRIIKHPVPSFLAKHNTTMAELKIHNTLELGGREPVPFIPIEEGKVSWYACGPTVYDHSHLGHARNYVSTDIIRRIMLHFFGYKVNFVMNITDVDDKVSLVNIRRESLLIFVV